MRKLKTGFSMETYWEELIYSEGSLSANHLTEQIVSSIIKLLEQYEVIISSLKQWKRDYIKASASLNAANYNADNEIRSFSLVLLSVVHGDRNSMIYKKFFKLSPSIIYSLPVADEIKEIERIVAELNLEENEKLKPFINSLKEAGETLKKRWEEIEKININYSAINNTMIEWKNEVNRMRMGLYGELLGIASRNGYSKSWAETFFKQQNNLKTKKTEQSST